MSTLWLLQAEPGVVAEIPPPSHASRAVGTGLAEALTCPPFLLALLRERQPLQKVRHTAGGVTARAAGAHLRKPFSPAC